MCGDMVDLQVSLTPALDSVLNSPGCTEDDFIVSSEKENKDVRVASKSTKKNQRVSRPVQQDLRVTFLLSDTSSQQTNLVSENAVASMTEAFGFFLALDVPDEEGPAMMEDVNVDIMDFFAIEAAERLEEKKPTEASLTLEEQTPIGTSLHRQISVTDALDAVLDNPEPVEDEYITMKEDTHTDASSRPQQAKRKQRVTCPLQTDLRIALGLEQSTQDSKAIAEDASRSLTEAMDALARLDQDLLEEAEKLVEEQRIRDLIGGATVEQLWEESISAEMKTAESEVEVAKLQEALAKSTGQIKQAQDKAEQQLKAAAEKARAHAAKGDPRAVEQLRSQNASLKAEIAKITAEIETLKEMCVPSPETGAQAETVINGVLVQDQQVFHTEDDQGRQEEIAKQCEANAKLKVMLQEIHKEINGV
eukprot:gnl/MRDRNA2_/MRDRNA2_117123_c0_seq1.p1 gnl/MRDRNA2_/MRDRNA2_117123_c0~~gnl/MRDRNA2_/MRDRNA2_117123_c0_seq1.p1  ORF type:complete len:420 (-),score=145.32 gnl/MRDRNA2_/MRDRNA2_117123_c0_seq1:158-1417(-)